MSLSLNIGDTIVLDQEHDQPMSIKLRGQHKLTARPGNISRRYGLVVEDVMQPNGDANPVYNANHALVPDTCAAQMKERQWLMKMAPNDGDSSIQEASFPDLGGMGGEGGGDSPNLDLIRDIQVTLTVELGRTDMMIEEVTSLTPGKVVELDKLAGEPLDILINGKLLTKGRSGGGR